jgi:hypothetical protein
MEILTRKQTRRVENEDSAEGSLVHNYSTEYARVFNVDVMKRILAVLEEYTQVKITNLAMSSKLNYNTCKMYGSSNGSLCGDSNLPNNYWLQGGMLFRATDSDGRIVWADTASGLGSIGCEAFNFSMVTYSDSPTNCPYRFDIFTAQSEVSWKITAIRLSPCTLQSQTISTSGMNGYDIDAATNYATSVFMEDKVHTVASTWEGQYGTDKPKAQQWYKPNGGGSWTAFTSESQQIIKCGGASESDPNIISGSAANAGTTTWDGLTTFADNYHANC